MNPEVKKIADKLFFSNQKVELAVTDPKIFDSEVYKAFSEANRFAENERIKIVNNYNKTLDIINEVMKRHSEEYRSLVKKADDLGLDFSSSQIGKEYLKIGSMINKYHLETLNQHQKYANIKP